MLLAFMYFYIQMKNKDFAENRNTLVPLGHGCWILKGHMKGPKATNCSTWAIL